MATLDTEFRQVILEMHLLATGTTQSLQGRVTGAKEGRLYPVGEANPPWEEYVARWASAHSDTARHAILHDARLALQRHRVFEGGPVIEPGSMAWRREIANRDLPDKELVRIYGVSRQTLWRYRRDYRTEQAA